MILIADDTIRVDKYISDELDEIPREKIKDFIKDKLILVNENQIKPSFKLKDGDEIFIDDSLFEVPELIAENIPLDVVYENDDFAVINKQKNLIVHPAGSIVTGTLVNALLFKYGYDYLSHIGGEDRPGIVHRLDKDTTGLMVIAKNNDSYRYLKNLFETRKVRKEYLAIVFGNFREKSARIENFMGRDHHNRRKMAVLNSGRKAISEYEVLSEVEGFSLVRVHIITGRTHQIRVHMTDINHPLLGDPVYGNFKHKFNLDHPLLHCTYLAFEDKNGEKLEFNQDPPEEFMKYLNILGLDEEKIKVE